MLQLADGWIRRQIAQAANWRILQSVSRQEQKEGEEVTRYPLSWPANWRRTPTYSRKSARFLRKKRYTSFSGQRYLRSEELSIHDGVKRVLDELSRFGILEGDSIISTNLDVRLDGLPRSNQREPDDPGVAATHDLDAAQLLRAINEHDYCDRPAADPLAGALGGDGG